jgi:pantoate--beta-alanine ligase
LRHEVRRILRSEPLVERIDYVSVADAQTLEELKVVDRKAMVSTAVKLGKPRLIDNILIG